MKNGLMLLWLMFVGGYIHSYSSSRSYSRIKIQDQNIEFVSNSGNCSIHTENNRTIIQSSSDSEIIINGEVQYCKCGQRATSVVCNYNEKNIAFCDKEKCLQRIENK